MELRYRPALGGKPYTRRVKPTCGSGTVAAPYTLFVPVLRGNEWTVQAVTGSNLNGASDADSWDGTLVAGGAMRRAAVQAPGALPLPQAAACLHALPGLPLSRLL